MERFVKTDAFRRSLTDEARKVAQTNEPIAIGTTSGRPVYSLVSVPERRRARTRCIRLGPDELRKNFTEIRALIRLEGIPFGVIVDDQLIAMLKRHPDYRPDAANGYRAMYRGELEKTEAGTAESRIAALEARVAEVSARLDAIESKSRTRAERRSPPATEHGEGAAA
jgi:hypothetical protein